MWETAKSTTSRLRIVQVAIIRIAWKPGIESPFQASELAPCLYIIVGLMVHKPLLKDADPNAITSHFQKGCTDL